jgi:hypothetical protein
MNAPTSQQPSPGLRHWHHAAVFMLAFAVIVIRRPDAVLHAQFYAEDGHAWFEAAYNLGWWPALFLPWAGIFQTLPRLVVTLAMIAPLSFVPLLLNVTAIGFHVFPVNALLSARSAAWGSLRFRALLAAMYLALPNCTELSFGITQSQWPMALTAFLILVASEPKSMAGRLFDCAIIILCGLSGPFCFFLSPIALLLALKHRNRWRWIVSGVIGALCLVQFCALVLVSPAGRPHHALGASPALFARILAGHVYLGTLIGSNAFAANSGPRHFVFLVCVAIGGTALLAACFVASAIEMRLFLAFSAMVFAASLISSTTLADVPAWQTLAVVNGVRYWFFPTLAFAWSLLWCAHSRRPALRNISVSLLLIMCIGIVRDWQHPAFPDMHFAEYEKQLGAAPAGSVVTIPENPEGWKIELVKRAH